LTNKIPLIWQLWTFYMPNFAKTYGFVTSG
jgi:hypothetical protein